jgi:hypothetical protein
LGDRLREALFQEKPGMKICILQPSYIPWKGFFHQIARSDVFVFFDTVQYDKRGWRNRNRIKTPQGLSWLTIPVQAKGTHNGLLIQDVCVQDNSWIESHLQKLRLNYKQAPHFKTEFPWIEAMFRDIGNQHERISTISAEMTKQIAQRLGIQTKFVYASELSVEASEPNERLLKIIKALQGTHYLSGPSAKNYMDLARFEAENILVEWMTYEYPPYPQLYPPFTHEVSILDLIVMTGSEQAGHYIWSPERELTPPTNAVSGV